MSKVFKIYLFVCLIFVSVTACAAVVYLKEFDFNEAGALNKWGKMILNGQVEYTLMKQGSDGYVQALSEKTASALYYRLGFDVKDYPYLNWKWRVLKFPDLSQAKTDKERDDYAARVYVIFPFLSFSSSKFIEYVWSEDQPVGKIFDSPVGSNIKMIVVRSGRSENSEWASERRNIHEDFVKAFGKEPGISAGAVAIMCDADSSNTSAEALFDDIAIEKK